MKLGDRQNSDELDSELRDHVELDRISEELRMTLRIWEELRMTLRT